ncbi:cbb3-type cytochrome c oxidase subunit I [Neokomagataea thailandica]|uniref:cbb3-type cytochrome c oxidase subunit I n=1 Tax=Neokomagataea TaxID=1223423 RepID=UPI00082B476C|nr:MULTISPECIES: cbb3-type cytochrome c oxidase subunit I [Neokomagataea]
MLFPAITSRPAFSVRKLGLAYLLLALFAGVLGGVLALPGGGFAATPGLVLCHGILMAFFVVIPACLGGFAQLQLPKALGVERTVLSGLSFAGFGLLSSGVVLLPLLPLMSLLLWALGAVTVAMDIIVTVLEGRTQSFRELPPFVWSLLATACGVIVVAPALAAMITRTVLAGIGRAAVMSAASFAHLLQVPEASLMLVPALGLICSLLPVGRGALSARIAPYVFACAGVLGPLLWLDSVFTSYPLSVVQVFIWVTQILPAVVMLGALLRDVWAERGALDEMALWGLGALLLLTAGWGPSLLVVAGGHSAAAFGSLMAVCGGLYAWLNSFSGGCVPGWLCRGHAVVTLLGALCSLTPSLGVIGGAVMGVSLLGFVAVGIVLSWQGVRAQVEPHVGVSS